jgi:hypothetical protein
MCVSGIDFAFFYDFDFDILFLNLVATVFNISVYHFMIFIFPKEMSPSFCTLQKYMRIIVRNISGSHSPPCLFLAMTLQIPEVGSG